MALRYDQLLSRLQTHIMKQGKRNIAKQLLQTTIKAHYTITRKSNPYLEGQRFYKGTVVVASQKLKKNKQKNIRTQQSLLLHYFNKKRMIKNSYKDIFTHVNKQTKNFKTYLFPIKSYN